MKNKIIILTSFFLIFSDIAFSADDMLYYLKAYSYIQNSEFVRDKYKPPFLVKPDSILTFVSAEVLSFSPGVFIDEIIKFEFDHCFQNEMYNVIKDYLELIPQTKVKEKREEMLLINKNSTGNVITFFSEVVGNKLMAIVKIYDDHYPPEYSYFSGYPSGNKIQLLFYFDDNNEIKKVFHIFSTG